MNSETFIFSFYNPLDCCKVSDIVCVDQMENSVLFLIKSLPGEMKERRTPASKFILDQIQEHKIHQLVIEEKRITV